MKLFSGGFLSTPAYEAQSAESGKEEGECCWEGYIRNLHCRDIENSTPEVRIQERAERHSVGSERKVRQDTIGARPNLHIRYDPVHPNPVEITERKYRPGFVFVRSP